MLKIEFEELKEKRPQSKQQEPSVYQKAIHELLCGLEEKDLEINNLKNKIHSLEHHVKTFAPFTQTLADQMKIEFLLEHWNSFTLESLELLHRQL